MKIIDENIIAPDYRIVTELDGQECVELLLQEKAQAERCDLSLLEWEDWQELLAQDPLFTKKYKSKRAGKRKRDCGKFNLSDEFFLNENDIDCYIYG